MPSPFDYARSLTETKEWLYDPNDDRDYSPYVVNKALSFNADCLFLVNTLNTLASVPKHAHYAFFYHSLDKKRRYGKWVKADAKDEDVQLVMDHYGYSYEKAKVALSLLPESEIEKIRMIKGGKCVR